MQSANKRPQRSIILATIVPVCRVTYKDTSLQHRHTEVSPRQATTSYSDEPDATTFRLGPISYMYWYVHNAPRLHASLTQLIQLQDMECSTRPYVQIFYWDRVYITNENKLRFKEFALVPE